MMMLVGGCCGGLYFAVPGPKWRAHESAKGGFKVDLPAPPRPDMDKIAGNSPDPNMTTEGTILFRALEEYAIVYGDVPPHERQWLSDKDRIDAAVQSMKSSGEVQSVLNQKDITVNGFPGREVEFSAKGSGYYGARVIVADGRVYVLVAGGKTSSPGNPNVRRFLDSFEITDPKLRASGDAKVAAGKRAEDQERQRKDKTEQDRLAREKAEAERHKEEARTAEQKRKAEEARRREVEAEAAPFRTGRPGRVPPDPKDVPGLVLHLPFDEIKGAGAPARPAGTAKLPAGATAGPGVRGSALYLAAHPGGASVANDALPPELLSGKPATVAGWVKTRDRAWCDLITVPNSATGAPALRAGFTDTEIRAQDRTQFPDPQWPRIGDPRRDRPLHADRPADNEWHHVAMVRRSLGGRTVVALYLDGVPVAVFPFGGPITRSVADGAVSFGSAVPLGAFTGRPNEFAVPRTRDGHFDVPDHDLPVAALDDVCAYGRALTDAEVRYLAGAGPKPGAEPQPVEFVRAATIDANNGVAFDPDRGAVWAVTAVAPTWRFEPVPKNAPKRAHLKTYSYPRFTAGQSYLLPSAQDTPGDGGPPVLAPKQNRLYMPLNFNDRSRNLLQRPWDGKPLVYPFDLNDLPQAKGPAAPQLDYGLARTPRADEVVAFLVAPDGACVYYLEIQANETGSNELSVCRMDADLKDDCQKVAVPRTAPWKGALWVSPDGKTLRTITSGKGNASDPRDAGVLEIDTATWKTTVIPLEGVNWSSPQASAWHPDGRLFISDGPFGILEFDLTAGTRRVRPVPLPHTELPWAPTSFLQVSADGRYLIASETEQRLHPNADRTSNRVYALDASREAPQLGALATAQEAEGSRVGGPCWVSPDGRFVAFRSGVVLHINDGRPLPQPAPRVPVAPAPRPVERD